GVGHDRKLTAPAARGSLSAISAGSSATCAIKSDNTTACWGDNSYGQSASPTGFGTITALTTGLYHTCAVKANGTAACWGENFYGQTTAPTSTVNMISAGDN